MAPSTPLPAFELPWATQTKRGRGRGTGGRRQGGAGDDTKRLVVYGAGALTGAVLLRTLRRRICGIPFLGLVATPLLALVPCTLLGAAAGGLAVYIIEEGGDVSAVRRKLLPRARRAAARAAGEAAALTDEIRREGERLAREGERLAREQRARLEREAADALSTRRLAEAAAEAERAVVPLVKREVEKGRAAVERALLELEAAAAAGGSEAAARERGAAQRHVARGQRWQQQRDRQRGRYTATDDEF